MQTFKSQYLLMFGACTEQDFFDDFLKNPLTKLAISAAASEIPANAIGYCDQLLRNPTAQVANDAIKQIRRHLPTFFAAQI